MTVIILSVLYLIILLFKQLSARWVIREIARRPVSTGIRRVTILQPILSGDPCLKEILAANVIALPDAQFLWLIDDDDLTAAEITQSLCQRYASANIEVISFAPAPDGVNPKSFKLEGAWRKATAGICLVLDDDASLSAESLASILAVTDSHCLVTALPHYRANQHWSSVMLTQFVNDNTAFTYLPLLPFAEPLTINGMCYALRTETLALLGGFAPILRHLTDDLAIAMLANQHGVKLVQLTSPVMVQTGTQNGRQYFRQMHRWFLFATLLMRRKSLLMNLLIFVLQGLNPLLLWGLAILGCQSLWLLLSGGSDIASVVGSLVIVFATLLVRALCIGQIQRQLIGSVKSHPWLSLMSELLQPVHLIHALCNRMIRWRTRRYRVFTNDKFISR